MKGTEDNTDSESRTLTWTEMSLVKRNDNKRRAAQISKITPRATVTTDPHSAGWGDEEKHPGVSQVLLFSFRTGKGLQNQKKTAESLRETEGESGVFDTISQVNCQNIKCF